MGALGIDTACDICGGDPQRCDEETRDGEVGKTSPDFTTPQTNNQDTSRLIAVVML